VVKIWQLIGGAPWRLGPPPMVQPAQWIIRPCSNRCRWLCRIFRARLNSGHVLRG